MEGSSNPAPQAGSSVPGGTGSSVASVVLSNPKGETATVKFKKTFQFYTGGFQFKKLLYNTLGPFSNAVGTGNEYLYTPLCNIDPNYLGWYMNHNEYKNLPAYSYATDVKIKVTPLGYRLPFETNEAVSEYANSQTLVQICYAIGLNNQVNMFDAPYNNDQSDLTTPTGLRAEDDPYERLYGSTGQDGTIGMNVGIPRHWNRYAVLVDTASGRTPNLMDLICIQNVNDCKGTPVINYEYQFKNGLLKTGDITRNQDGAFGLTTAKPMGNEYPLWSDKRIGQTTAAQPAIPIPQNHLLYSYSASTHHSTTTADGLNLHYDQPIDKAPFLVRQEGDHTTPDHPPLVHVGVMPVQSNAVLGPTASFSNVAVQWMIQTEITVHYHYNYWDPTYSIPYLKMFSPDWINIKMLSDDGDYPFNQTRPAAFYSNRRINPWNVSSAGPPKVYDWTSAYNGRGYNETTIVEFVENDGTKKKVGNKTWTRLPMKINALQ